MMRRRPLSRILILLLLALIGSTGSAVSQISIDRAALMDLYNATNGPNWTNNTNWGSELPIGEWYGITQSASSGGEFAQIIDLRNNNLEGQIPPTWPGHILEGAFRDLVHLILDDNPISGSVLPEYGSLGNLVSLSFSNTNLSGSIPSSLSELQNLQFLSFFNNSLSGPLPEGIFFIETLRTLQVTLNQLSGTLPTGIGSHESLVNLRLGFNEFTGPIPSDIASGASLVNLSLEFNQLSGSIPPNIADGPSLQTLHLDGNQLTGPIPPEIGGSTTLLRLQLGGNPLSGSIPPELGTLRNLEELGLGETGMEGTVPETLGNLTRLRWLDLAYNQLTGEVPASIANLQNLEEVFLSGNSFDVLPDLSGISSLFRLYVDDNRFEFDDLLPYVEFEDFAYSPQKRFDSPQSISITAGQTATLDASAQQSPGNQYQWRINGDPIGDAASVQYTIQNAQPADAGVYTLAVTNSSLPALTLVSADIDVSVDASALATDRDALIALYNATGGANWTNNTNWLTEEPLAEWYGVTESSAQPGSVDMLDLRNNNLAGQIPLDWGAMITEEGVFAHLTRLDLSQNVLTDSLRSFLGGLSSLQELYLHENFLEGGIPAELAWPDNLRVLRLDDNTLSGFVPFGLTVMPELVELHIQTNFLEDLEDFSSAPNLQILNTQNNLFQFDDLEPNVEIAEFSYIPQRKFGETNGFNLPEGNDLLLSFTVGGSNNEYQWLLNSTPIEGATENQYQISGATPEDGGSYTLQVTSPVLPELVLESNTLFVEITPPANQGEFVVTNTNDSGDGSLRAAIAAANANPNEPGILDEITFDISGGGPHIIRPQSPLPVITESVSIDGTTQSFSLCGDTIASRDLRIVLDGSEAGPVEGGLVFRENENTALVSGLVINNFTGAGILVDKTPFTQIQCSFIGTDVTGFTAAPNSIGIDVVSSDNVLIGAGTAETGNLISGNDRNGVRLRGQTQPDGPVAGGAVVYGNLIGTDRLGSAAVPNSTGVSVSNGSALIGGPGEFQYNVISGNSFHGVKVSGVSSAGTFLTNNFIGTNVAGTSPIPNGEGVRIDGDAQGVTVGIFTNLNDEGWANTIAYNNGAGVVVVGSSSTGNRISANRMFENAGLGIDLGGDGLTLNDIGDDDEGPNRLINSPQIVSSTIDNAGDLVVSYLVESGGEALNIEFFEADADGEEGARYLGADTYSMNEAGQTVQFNLGNANDLGITDPDAIVATAIDSFGNTSEFSGAGIEQPVNDQITVTEPTDVDAVSGSDAPMQATLPSGFNSDIQQVCYRRIGETEFTCTQLQGSGSEFQGAIPSSFVTERGVQYYFRFSDGTTETTVPETDPVNSPFVLPVRVSSLRAGGSFSANTYRMVSIPVELSDGSFESVLDEYGAANPNRWRLLRWEPTLEDYREYPDLTGGFNPCEAYWLITFDGDDFEIENGESVNPTEPCFVTVRPGWNQFGSPYAFPVAWSDVNVSGAVDGPVLYDASADDIDPYQYDVEVLEPWQGYWLFNPGTTNVFMSFNPVEAIGTSGKNADTRRLAGDEYEVRLRASLPEHGLVDSRNRIGLTTRASTGFDDLDFAEAPPIGDHIRLSILENGMRLAGSFRPEDDRGQSWDIQITSDVDGAPASGIVRVSLDEFGVRPEGFGLRLVDLDQNLPVRIDNDGFEVELTGASPVRNLRLIVGTDAFSDEAGGSIPEVPEHAELAQNYPNPFNPSTRIRYQVHVDGPVEIAVFDPLGRRIRTLVDANREPGWYETVWNGRDESGTDVSSGLYFYTLKTTDGSVSRTMVLLR